MAWLRLRDRGWDLCVFELGAEFLGVREKEGGYRVVIAERGIGNGFLW